MPSPSAVSFTTVEFLVIPSLFKFGNGRASEDLLLVNHTQWRLQSNLRLKWKEQEVSKY